jgi:hypothetical protein
MLEDGYKGLKTATFDQKVAMKAMNGYKGDLKTISMRHVEARERVGGFRISCTSEPPISTSITQTSTRRLTSRCAMSPRSMPCLCRRSTYSARVFEMYS